MLYQGEEASTGGDWSIANRRRQANKEAVVGLLLYALSSIAISHLLSLVRGSVENELRPIKTIVSTLLVPNSLELLDTITICHWTQNAQEICGSSRPGLTQVFNLLCGCPSGEGTILFQYVGPALHD